MPRDIRLSDFEQSLSTADGTANTFEVLKFPGVSPIVVRQDQGLIVVTQSGRAVAFGAAFVPPTPIYSTVLGDPQTSVKRQPGALEWETTWSFTMATDVVTFADRIAAAKWPDAPAFEEVD